MDFLFEGWVGFDDGGGFLAGEGGEFGVFEGVKIEYPEYPYFIGFFLISLFIFIGL